MRSNACHIMRVENQLKCAMRGPISGRISDPGDTCNTFTILRTTSSNFHSWSLYDRTTIFSA